MKWGISAWGVFTSRISLPVLQKPWWVLRSHRQKYRVPKEKEELRKATMPFFSPQDEKRIPSYAFLCAEYMSIKGFFEESLGWPIFCLSSRIITVRRSWHPPSTRDRAGICLCLQSNPLDRRGQVQWSRLLAFRINEWVWCCFSLRKETFPFTPYLFATIA